MAQRLLLGACRALARATVKGLCGRFSPHRPTTHPKRSANRARGAYPWRRPPSPHRLLPLLLLAAGGLTLAGCGRLFFYPEKALLHTPADLGVRYHEVRIPSLDGVTLHGWFLPARAPARGSILFLHGNAENISTHVAAVYWLPARGFNVLALDYRGFGRSRGKAGVRGVHMDAQAALRFLATREGVDPERLFIFGQSIGGAIALHTAATTTTPIRAVIAESAFASYPGIMREKLAESWLTWPFQWMAAVMTSRYDPIAVIDRIPPAATLLIHGDRDAIVPVREAYRLFAAARGDKELWIVAGGGHIAAFSPARRAYRDRLVRYLSRHLTRAPPPPPHRPGSRRPSRRPEGP